ncbi:flavodoxin [Methanocorpusculum sp. MG]|uniref:Flavodoxin n=1 Tax=Methanocorpusculum petauri TaxID=3002863 RepID=A0ABT4IED2_9EURY|nr:flavodoxin [Methanocorpusculum petauri]MCZ0860093.1 flavodoxin [Methanocorpusculum petauri]
MKTIGFIRTLAVLLLAAVLMAGCVSTPSDTGPETAVPTQTAVLRATEPTVTDTQNITGGNETAPKILIAYFSRTGNTETIANMIAEETSGTLFEIVPEVSYPEDYTECTEIARQEQNDNARPALATHVENMNEYDVVFVGYPIWWGTMPMMMFTFLEEYDLDGKTIVPFCTSGGTGLGRSVTDIRTLCPNATIADGFTVGGSSAADARDRVADWIADLDLV